MAGLYNILYPNYTPSRVGLDGGLNTKFDSDAIDDNESQDCQNVVFGLNSVRTRYGTSNFNTTPIATYACDGLYTRHDRTGAETMLAWYGGTLFECSGTTFTSITSSKSIFVAGNQVAAAEYANYIFFGDGSNIPYKWNGSDFTRHGVYPPTSHICVASDGTGALNGCYSYKLTYVNSLLVESEANAVTSMFTVSNKSTILSDIPVPPQSYGINTKNLYRTVTSGTVWKYVASMAASVTTYTDSLADSALGVEAPSDRGVPPNYGQVVSHQGRLFAIDNQNNWVVYSDINDPFNFAAESFIYVGDKTGDIPKVLAVYDNNIYVGCANSHWLIYMPSADETTWTPIRLRLHGGSLSNFAPFYFNQKLMVACVDAGKFVGFAAIAGTAIDIDRALVTSDTSGSEFLSNKIEPLMFNISTVESKVIHSQVYKNKAYISVRESEAYNDKIYVFDFSIENLSKRQKHTWAPWVGLNIASWTIYGGKLYGAQSTTDGYIIEMEKEDQYYDAINSTQTAIDSYYVTKDFQGNKGQESFWKDFRWLNLKFKASDRTVYMSVYPAVNQQDFGSYKDINMISGGTKWEELVWNEGLWGNVQTNIDLRNSIGGFAGKSIKFKFTNKNTIGYFFNINGLSFLYNIKGRR